MNTPEYFKSHLDSLPHQERRIYLALADLWKPATTREIADRTRLSSSTCSAQLKRLINRGVVREEGGTPRRKRYYLVERLYNIYYLLRRKGNDSVVRALIRFMASFYSQSDLMMLDDDLFTDKTAYERDLKAILPTLPTAESLPDSAIRALTVFSVHLGPSRTLELIQGSAAAELLLPLVTALQQEAGHKPRVAREVDEVAQDIRKELAKIRTLVPLPARVTTIRSSLGAAR